MTVNRLVDKVIASFKSSEVRWQIYIITLLMALFILAITIKGPEQKGTLIIDNAGRVTGIDRDSLSVSESYDLVLDIQTGGNISQRPVTLVLRPYNNATRITEQDSDEVKAAEINSQIDGIITTIEYSSEETLELPTSLEDGTTLTWRAAEAKHNESFVIVPFVYLALITMAIKSHLDADADKEAVIRREILHDLPRFCNQLFLMMNAGMILSDAFERICSSYLEISEEEQSWFQKEMINIYIQNADHHKGAAVALNEFAAEYNVKELTRIAAILSANEKRGSDVVNNLSRESKYLWDDRKLIARESGKTIDVKMSYPLGALLLLLIVITMAPAMLNI